MNTPIYTQLVDLKTNEYISKVAKMLRKHASLTETSFEYACTTPENLMIFMRQK